MLANIVITMAFSNVRLVSRWLPRLGATRSISMSPTLQSNTSLASEGRTIFQMLRNDASVVAIVIGMVSIASYTLYSVSRIILVDPPSSGTCHFCLVERPLSEVNFIV